MSLEPSPAPVTAAQTSGLHDDSTSNQHQQETGMIGSLGDALAGVTLGPSGGNNSAFGSRNPFNVNVNASSHQIHHPPSGESSGWGGFSLPEASRNSFARSSAATNQEGREDQVRVQESNAHTHSTPDDAERKKSIDLFLSRDVFKELSTGNLPGLAIPEETDHAHQHPHQHQHPHAHQHAHAHAATNFRATGGQPGQPSVLHPNVNINGNGAAGNTPSGHPEQRRGSPSSNVTGTTASNTTGSRSNSPYEAGAGNAGVGAGNQHNAHTIQAYQSYDQNINDVSAPSAYQPAPTSNISMSPRPNSSYNMYTNNSNSNSNAALNQHYSSPATDKQAQSMTPVNNSLPPQQQPQQQILYMAVPTPDGRQVLQPVQMVQVPGKPFAYVLPGSEGMPAMQGGMPGMQGGGQHMMVMPTMVPQQGQLGSPVGVPPRQQPSFQGHQHQHQQNDIVNGLIGGTGSGGRNHNHIQQNKNMVGGGYQNSVNDINGAGYGIGNTLSGLRADEYNPMQGQGNIESGDPHYQNQPTDPALASLYSTPQRPPLDALLGQVRKLSRDQVGCRLVQQALDEEGPMAATLILNEGLPFWGEAMVDPFGNYLFQKILEKITAEERIMLVKSVSTRLVNASLNLHGTRSVQKIVELCTMDEKNSRSAAGEKDGDKNEETAADVLTKALTPAAARLCIDSHGNHVIQRILLKLGHKHSKFVFDAVAESVGDVARHRHGCCVIQRCLDSPPGAARSNLVCRIVDKSLELMQDAYGNYVVQYVLDVCSDDDVHAVCESVIGKVNLLAIQKFSSNVMEKCLERCTDRVKEHYMQELSDPERIRELMMDPFGNYVVQRALSVATHTQAVRLVEAMRPHLIAQTPGTPNGQRNGGVRNTAGGRRIMAKICRRFPNFNLNATGTREELYSQNRGRHHHNNHHHQATPVVPPMYGAMPQLASAPIHVMQQSQQQQQQQQLYTANLTDYNTNQGLAINPLNMGGLQQQFDQRQTYYDPGADANYFQQQQQQQQQQTPHFGQGAYQSPF
mmetsp:Transcript_3803/g.8530  ORF Transcript_3803/g.8530 Transcript_3803/m.8530 type:complete len:1021 (+) Transcript_3803:63-3125(+)